MQFHLRSGGALLVALAAPAAAGQAQGVAATAPAEDAILARLNALEARVRQLEARNAELEAANARMANRVGKVEVDTAAAVQPGPAPTFADPGGAFSFKPRGTLEIDHTAWNSRAGGYDYNNGTDIRRGRFGFDGTAFRRFRWRIEAEYVRGTVNLLDAYLQYPLGTKLAVTVGQHKAPAGIEANSSDNFNSFLERGMAVNAFGAIGAERRVGASLAWSDAHLHAALGLFGSGETIGRNATTPDEGWGMNGRIVWEPVHEETRLVHLGVSGWRATNFAADALAVEDRPGSRVDGGRIVSAAVPGVRHARFLGVETALVHGPFSLQGEYGRVAIARAAGLADLDFDGFYLFGSWFLTGESRSFKGGTVDRVKPFDDFDPGEGKWGAVELLARYDRLDLTDHGLSPLARRATSWTAALNWYLNPNTKFMFNWIRFKGLNSPLVVDPVLNGTTAKGDAFASRLHFDF